MSFVIKSLKLIKVISELIISCFNIRVMLPSYTAGIIF